MKLLIIGHARHGKDTVAQMITDEHKLKFKSSSVAAAELFLYDELKEKYGYENFHECFEDRMNHRQEWYEAIVDYNTPDKARLARDIMADNDIYVGMRDNDEIMACLKDNVFDLIIGVYNPHKPFEEATSFNIDMWHLADIVIPNAGTLDELRVKVWNLPL